MRIINGGDDGGELHEVNGVSARDGFRNGALISAHQTANPKFDAPKVARHHCRHPGQAGEPQSVHNWLPRASEIEKITGCFKMCEHILSRFKQCRKMFHSLEKYETNNRMWRKSSSPL